MGIHSSAFQTSNSHRLAAFLTSSGKSLSEISDSVISYESSPLEMNPFHLDSRIVHRIGSRVSLYPRSRRKTDRHLDLEWKSFVDREAPENFIDTVSRSLRLIGIHAHRNVLEDKLDRGRPPELREQLSEPDIVPSENGSLFDLDFMKNPSTLDCYDGLSYSLNAGRKSRERPKHTTDRIHPLYLISF